MENRLMITVDEEELFDIMCDYAEIEHKLHYFLIVLNALKDHYDGEMMNDVYENLMVIIGYLTAIQMDFKKTMTRTDEFLLKKK